MIGLLRIFKYARKRIISLSLENRTLKLENKVFKTQIENLVAYLESRDKDTKKH